MPEALKGITHYFFISEMTAVPSFHQGEQVVNADEMRI